MSFIEAYLTELKGTFDKLPYSQIETVKNILLQAYRENRRIL
jgi:hypothetical protein